MDKRNTVDFAATDIKVADFEAADFKLTEFHVARWYALTIKHQHERPAQAALDFKGWESFAPHYKAQRKWSDRVRAVELPLFPGYVFCRFPYVERISVLNTPSVGRIVGFGGVPAPVEDAEMDGLQALIASNLPVRPWPYLKAGDRVRLERGPLRGLEGTLVREKSDCRLVLNVELLQRSVAVEIDPDLVTPVRPHKLAS